MWDGDCIVTQTEIQSENCREQSVEVAERGCWGSSWWAMEAESHRLPRVLHTQLWMTGDVCRAKVLVPAFTLVGT